jgi:hypothetical protein
MRKSKLGVSRNSDCLCVRNSKISLNGIPTKLWASWALSPQDGLWFMAQHSNRCPMCIQLVTGQQQASSGNASAWHFWGSKPGVGVCHLSGGQPDVGSQDKVCPWTCAPCSPIPCLWGGVCGRAPGDSLRGVIRYSVGMLFTGLFTDGITNVKLFRYPTTLIPQSCPSNQKCVPDGLW